MDAETNAHKPQSVPISDVQFAVDALFAYLRDILYAPKDAYLDPEAYAEPFRELAKGMLFIGKCINESRELANDLAKGNLDSIKISPDNDLASGLKSFQSTLKHISWQAGQVAKGDYNQTLSFAGALSEAINDMTQQLKERDEALRAEIQRNQQLAADARKSAVLLEGITKSIAELIVVIDRTSHEWLYTNHSILNFLPNKGSVDELKANLEFRLGDYERESSAKDYESEEPLQDVIELITLGSSLSQFFSVAGYPLTWADHKAMVFILVDVTEEERERKELKQVAYHDTLTAAYSRHFGMLELDRWLKEKEQFVLAFADMDGLKYVNDTFGHATGDEYILATAQALAEIDEQVVISRLGGDEFMVLTRGVTEAEARKRFERVRKQLEEGHNGAYERSFSFGLVEVGRDNTKSASFLLSIADESMYEDKRSRKKERRAES